MPRGPIIPPLPKTPLLENPFFQLETFRYISQRNLLRFIQRLIELRDPSKPLEERKSGYIISRGRALASLDHLLKQLGYLQSLSRGKRNKRRGIALWCILPAIGGAYWMGSSGKAGQAWIPVFLLGLMGVENEMEVIFYTILIARVNTVIQFLERNAMVEEDFSDVEENAEGLQKNLEGWAWSVIQWG